MVCLRYFVVIGGSVNNVGSVLLYKLVGGQYKYISVLYQDKSVSMIECPNFVKVTEYQYLLFYSAHERVFGIAGDFVRTTYYFNTLSDKKILDFGKQIYAMQAFRNNSQIISFSWLLGFAADKFNGAYTIPRVLSVNSKYKIFVNPYEGIRSLYTSASPVIHYNSTFAGDYLRQAPDLMDFQVTIPPKSLGMDWSFGFNVHQDKPDKGVFIVYQHATKTIAIADTESSPARTVTSDQISVTESYGVKLRIIVDRAVIEVFVNEGETVGAYNFKEQSMYQFFYAKCSNPEA